MTTQLVQEMFGTVAHLPSISLEDLQTEASFLTRLDRKYLVPAREAAVMFGSIDRRTRVLEIDGRRSFGYLTPYFDDNNFTAYLRAARRRPNRFKVRTRLYTDSGICMLELKVRDGRGLTVKHRIQHDAESLELLMDSERNWLGAFPQVESFAEGVRHQMTTFYRRFTLVMPNGEGRVTVDRDLTFAVPDGRNVAIPSYMFVETKGTGSPTPIDRLLWANGHRPVSISKFAAGLSLLVPELPSNRWHRVHSRLMEAVETTETSGSPACVA